MTYAVGNTLGVGGVVVAVEVIGDVDGVTGGYAEIVGIGGGGAAGGDVGEFGGGLADVRGVNLPVVGAGEISLGLDDGDAGAGEGGLCLLYTSRCV